MTKKLEPGCKAVTVNCTVSENNGKIVTVLRIGEPMTFDKMNGQFMTETCVYVDRAFVKNNGLVNNRIPISQLRRIDDKEETTTWEAMRDLWVPEQVKTVHKVTE